MAQYLAGISNNNNNNKINEFSAKTGVGTLLLHQGGVPNDVIGVEPVGKPLLRA